MYRPRPSVTEDLTCEICGKPAKWYDRVFHANYVLGEALCDECNTRFINMFKPLPIMDEAEDNQEVK